MLRIPAHTAAGPIGWLQIPEKQHFSWTLRIEPTPRTLVMVPVKAQSQDRGWTHYYYADISTLTPAQIDLLLATRWLKPVVQAVAA